MRIEKVALNNINSLYGKFEIDFTHEAYSEGLFAIVGASGSGKSTVLDAMCLALYGRTPRITVSDMHDEAMNRTADKCTAEVVFVSGAKRYRSVFEHRKTIRSAKPFMSPKNELFEYLADGSQKQLSDNATEAKHKVTEIVGLDYDQFTRSVMLAQFKFAEFLSAKANERAEILEQVSGTDIYRRISVAVYQKQKGYKTILDEIRIKKETINVLEPAQVKGIKDELINIDEAANRFEGLNDKLELSAAALTETDKQRNSLAQFEMQKRSVAQTVQVKSKAFDTAAEEEKLQRERGKELQKTLVAVRELDLTISAVKKEMDRAQLESDSAGKDILEKKNDILRILQHHLPGADAAELKRIYEADNEADIIREHISAELTSVEEKQRSQKADIEKLLQDKDEKYWRDKQETLAQALPLLQAKQAVVSAEQSLKTLRKNLTELQITEKETGKLVEENAEKFLLAKLQEKYGEQRKQLSDGQPCPLCGAREHPSAHEHLDTSFAAATQQEKTQLEARMDKVNTQITRINLEVDSQVNIIADNEEILKGNEALLENLDAKEVSQIKAQIEQIKQLLNQIRHIATQEVKTSADVLALTKQLGEVDKDVAEIKHAKSTIVDIARRRAEHEKALQESGKSKSKLSDKRRSSFGDKDPDAQEAVYAKALTAVEENTAATRQRLQESKAVEVRNTNDIDRTKAQIESLGKKLTAAYTDVKARAAAIRSVEPLEQTDMYDTVLSQAAMLKDTAEQSRETMTDLAQSLSIMSRKLRERIGEARNKLRENESKKKRIKEFESQEKQTGAQFKKWSDLSSLIGSADGIKFSRIAQGITFDVLLMYANQSLAKMSDRYILVRDDASHLSPLEINVIDNYQADDIRPVSNLSGGESFVVSMALALGLSEMSSGKTQIDSLFIDEGFASLDENYLELALQTLSTLGNRENKLIGVISHVKELKERIDTQIEVSALTGGRSTLTGPGVTVG